MDAIWNFVAKRKQHRNMELENRRTVTILITWLCLCKPHTLYSEVDNLSTVQEPYL